MTTWTADTHPTTGSEKKHWLRWTLIALGLIIVGALIAARLYLGVWALNYVNNILHHIKGYDGSVKSLDIDLYRGAYRLNKLRLDKKEGTIPTPFIAFDTADISIQWSALLHRRVVASVELIRPTINFAVKNDVKQTGQDVDWTKPIKDIVPVDINHIDLNDGTIAYKDYSSTPNVDIYIHHLNGYVRNLRNVENPADPLPSSLDIKGTSIGDGHIEVAGRLNILKEVPDMNLATKLEHVHLQAMNNYSNAYAAFKFKDGDLDIYNQIIVKNKHVTGYIKLLASKVSVDIANTANPLQTVWSAMVAGLITIFTNQSKDQFAARVDLDGTLDNIDTDMWSALGSIISNAFIDALKHGFDQSGHGDALKDKAPQPAH